MKIIMAIYFVIGCIMTLSSICISAENNKISFVRAVSKDLITWILMIPLWIFSIDQDDLEDLD